MSVFVVGGWAIQWPWIAALAGACLPVAWLCDHTRWTARLLPLVVHGSVILMSLSAGVFAVIGVTVLALGKLPDAGERHVLAWATVGAAVAAICYEPVRRALLARVFRAVYSGRPRPDRLSSTVGSGLSRAVPLDDTLQYVAECAVAALELSRVSIWLEAGLRLERVASHPPRGHRAVRVPGAALAGLASQGPRGPAWLETWIPELLADGERDLCMVPILSGGELLGVLLAESEPGRELGVARERSLREVAVQLGPVLRSARLDSALSASTTALRELAQELRESRARVVSAADSERRRLERDLHDGAQQHLVALIFNLRIAAGLVQSDPKRATARLVDLEVASSEALDDLRALSQGIYPSLLSESGLGPALEAAAGRLSLGDAVSVSLADRPSAQLEAAIYFVCLEAMQNAAKHAGSGANVQVRVGRRERAIVLEVTDDGHGFDCGPAAERIGLTNIRDRIGALGGTVEIASSPGHGTRVAATVPAEQPVAPTRVTARPANR